MVGYGTAVWLKGTPLPRSQEVLTVPVTVIGLRPNDSIPDIQDGHDLDNLPKRKAYLWGPQTSEVHKRRPQDDSALQY